MICTLVYGLYIAKHFSPNKFQSSSGGSQSVFVIAPLTKLTRYSSESSEASNSPDVSFDKSTPPFSAESCKCEFKDIGRGKYGQVFEVKSNGKVYAAKEYFNISPEELNKLFSKLSGLKHDNLVTYHGVYQKIDSDNSGHPVVFMDLVNQNLPAVIEDMSRDIDSRTTLSIVCDIARGLIFLHEKGIFHCDLIPNNILLTAELRAKVSDYGNACVQPIHTACTHQDRYICDYLPPEAIAGNSPDAKVDVFSFGHLLIYIVLRYQPHPLEKAVFKENGKHMARSELQRREKFVIEMSIKVKNGELQPLLEWTESCLDNDACTRPELTELLSIFNMNT